jgi:RNA 3'-terminal phosphate cyclase
LQANILLDKCTDEKAETLAKEMIEKIVPLYENAHMCTDEYHTDQLMVFMALAEGTSRMACNDLSLHS